MDDLMVLFEYLKGVAKRTNAKRSYVDFTTEEGNVFRVEYRAPKRKE